MSVYLVDGHVTVIDWHEFDVGGILDGMPDELSVIGLLEPTPERVMPTQVRVDCVIHRRNVALSGHITAGDDLPGEVQTGGAAIAVVTKMLLLHVADRHRADVCLSRLFGAAAVGCQDVTEPGSPTIHQVRQQLSCRCAKRRPPTWPDSGSGNHTSLDQHTLGYGCSRPAPAGPRPNASRTTGSRAIVFVGVICAHGAPAESSDRRSKEGQPHEIRRTSDRAGPAFRHRRLRSALSRAPRMPTSSGTCCARAGTRYRRYPRTAGMSTNSSTRNPVCPARSSPVARVSSMT